MVLISRSVSAIRGNETMKETLLAPLSRCSRLLPNSCSVPFDPYSPLWSFQSFKDRGGDGRSTAVRGVLVHLPPFKEAALTIAKMPALIASGRTGQEHPEHLHFIYTRIGRHRTNARQARRTHALDVNHSAATLPNTKPTSTPRKQNHVSVPWHARGQGFKSPILHSNPGNNKDLSNKSILAHLDSICLLQQFAAFRGRRIMKRPP